MSSQADQLKDMVRYFKIHEWEKNKNVIKEEKQKTDIRKKTTEQRNSKVEMLSEDGFETI